MRTFLRASFAFALSLALLSGMLGLLGATPAYAQSTTIEITDVYNSVSPADEWFQLYNMTKGPITLTGWSICTSGTCLSLPTTTINSFSLAKFKANALSGWPANGLDGSADLLALKDDTGAAINSLNWGTPSSSWTNYAAFQPMLWNPGIKPPDAAANQSFFRMAIGKDSNSPSDWLTTASRVPSTPVPSTPVPTATTAPGGSQGTGGGGTGNIGGGGTGTGGGGTGTGGGGNVTPTGNPPNPKTGGEFPLYLAVGLIVVVLLIRYFRRGFTPSEAVQVSTREYSPRRGGLRARAGGLFCLTAVAHLCYYRGRRGRIFPQEPDLCPGDAPTISSPS